MQIMILMRKNSDALNNVNHQKNVTAKVPDSDERREELVLLVVPARRPASLVLLTLNPRRPHRHEFLCYLL
jgi:hypothetical protein